MVAVQAVSGHLIVLLVYKIFHVKKTTNIYFISTPLAPFFFLIAAERTHLDSV